MKVTFVKARGQFKAGDAADIEAKDFDALNSAGFVVTASEYASIVKNREEGKSAIVQAVDALVTSGSIAVKDKDGIVTATQAAFEAGTPATILVRLLQAEHKPLVQANATHTGRLTSGAEIGGGMVIMGKSLADSLNDGYVKAREPMDKLIKAGNWKEATRIAKETGARLSNTVRPILARGENFSFSDVFPDGVVKAADTDNVDTNVGTLNTGMVMIVRTFGFLKNKLTFLDKITTDLRNEAILFGQTALTRYVTPPTVLTFVPGVGLTSDAATIATWQATVSQTVPGGTVQTSGTQTRSTPSTTDVSVQMNNYKGVSIAFDNVQLASTLRNLPGEQYDAQLYSLTEAINQDLLVTLFKATWTGISAAAFSLAGGASPTAQNFGLANIIAIKNKFSLNKMPDVGRFALMHSSYHDAILTDSNLLTAKAILSLIKKDAGSFEDGELPVLFGVRVLESQLSAFKAGALVTITDPTQIPATATTVGFAGNSASAIFVARLPQDYNKILGDIPQTASLEVVTEPDSGLSMLVKKRVDHNLERTFVDCGLMWKFAQGDPRQGFLLNP